MPFSDYVGIKEKEWTEVFENIFKPAIESSGFGYRCERSQITAGSFTKDIVENMKNAHVVLADITGFNGNVMWELGVRHALSPRTIMVGREKILDTRIISDLRIYGVHFYDNNAGSISRFKKEIKESLKKIEDNPERSDNPVFDFLKIEDLILTSYGRKQIINKLIGILSELIENVRISEGIENKKFRVTKTAVTSARFDYQAIKNLLINNYVYPGENLIKDLFHFTITCKNANGRLSELRENIKLRNVSDASMSKLVNNILDTVKDIAIDSKELIKNINHLMESIQKGYFDYDEPKILIIDSKHQSLLK